MGNEQSQSSGIEIDEKAVEVSDFWSQHSASILGTDNCTSLTVFIGELFVSGSLWSSQTPLEKGAKNMMIFRHPCIVKYVSSWQKNSKFYLAVEEVTPLSQILSNLNTLQISIGLYSILKALNFLHNASVSHNNICITSIYVTKDGNWKLGGMEYLCRYKDINCDYLSKTRSSRYNKSVDPNEDKLFNTNSGRKDFIDVYAFGILVGEVLKSKSDDEIPTLSSFCDYCKNHLQNTDIAKRPTFKSILDHEFFSHEFLTIHSFLVELPLKNDDEKTQFFQNLAEKLVVFDEQIVASQLSGLLLSRLVLFNKTAQENLLPVLLMPQSDAQQPSNCIFSEATFRKYLCPKLLEIFRVRDAQIRLLLLKHLPNFMHVFTCEDLQAYILPELLVGIKDTNDHLVAVTLRTLADLVPLLGAATVVGGKRAKLFNDGRPTHSPSPLKSPEIVVVDATCDDEADQTSSSIESNIAMLNNLPERPRPDGEEGETSTEEVEVSVDEDLDNWEDWEVNESHQQTSNTTNDDLIGGVDRKNVRTELNKAKIMQIAAIEELDIKNQVDLGDNSNNDFDFFQDMEPIIDRSNKFIINEADDGSVALEKTISSKLAVTTVDDGNEEGWGEEEWN